MGGTWRSPHIPNICVYAYASDGRAGCLCAWSCCSHINAVYLLSHKHTHRKVHVHPCTDKSAWMIVLIIHRSMQGGMCTKSSARNTPAAAFVTLRQRSWSKASPADRGDASDVKMGFFFFWSTKEIPTHTYVWRAKGLCACMCVWRCFYKPRISKLSLWFASAQSRLNSNAPTCSCCISIWCPSAASDTADSFRSQWNTFS